MTLVCDPKYFSERDEFLKWIIFDDEKNEIYLRDGAPEDLKREFAEMKNAESKKLTLEEIILTDV